FVDDTVTDYSRPSPTIASTSAEGQNKYSPTSEDVASSNPPKPFVKRRVQRETTRSQKYAYESPSHRSVGHTSHRPSLRPSYRPTGHRPHGSAMNPRRPSMNVRTQYRAPWVRTVNRNNPPVSRKFSTGRRNFPTVTRKFPTTGRKFTTGSIKNQTADMGRKGKAVKPSACWTWNPSHKLSNKGPNNNSVSVMFKKYTYIDTQGRLKSVMAWVPKEN
nr:hypothetical protein [Tanacetum cinerariifolium]